MFGSSLKTSFGSRLVTPPPPAAGQPNPANIKLQFTFNGDDGSTDNLLDVSGNSLDFARQADSVLDTAQKQWGTASGNILGGDGRYDKTNSSILRLDAKPFFMEVWGRYTGSFGAAPKTMFSHRNSAGSNNGFIWRMLADKTMEFRYSTDGDNGFIILSAINSFNANEWHHMACTRDSSGNVRLFLRGKLIKTQNIGSDIIFNHTQPWGIGAYRFSGSNWLDVWNGWLDDFRYGLDEPLYTANFTPPIAPHPAGLLELEGGIDHLILEDGTGNLELE